MKYFVITYGCQMNKSDSERITAVLEDIGYEPAQKIDEADLVVVNMCSVRQSAVNRVYGLLSKFQKLKIQTSRFAPCNSFGIKKNLKFKIMLTGCILKKDRRKFAQYFDYILDIKNLAKWPKILQYHGLVHGTKSYLDVKPKYKNKLSAFVPIMTGCNNFCAYCVVPYTRGREISRPVEEIICEVKNLIKRGAKEIWLLGQNVNNYKGFFKQIKLTPQKGDRLYCESSFPQLLRKINDLPGNFWIRFTSSHPKDFSDELIEAMANCEKVTEYLNLPVQSGDNEILKKMNRHYTIKYYKNLVKKIRKKIPNISLSTDVIVGFPEETKKQFENTVKLFKEIKYDMAYIAKYSPRPGTKGAKLTDNVPAKEKKKREKVLTEILKKTALENNKKYIGKEIEVLMIDNCTGKTRTNKTVKFQVSPTQSRFQRDGTGQAGFKLQDFVKVKITDALPWGLKGKIKKAT